jgi:hypothetical protein
MPNNKTVLVFVPLVIKKPLDILEQEITDAKCDDMMCNGCEHEMGSANPKGFFKTSQGWLKLCHACLVKQGFLTE